MTALPGAAEEPCAPRTDAGALRLPVSASISGSCRKSKMWSPAAAAVCIWVMPWARVLKGEVNSRTYIIKATITPKEIAPFIARADPRTHTATYPRFPTIFIRGCITPDRNWLRHSV